MNKIKTEWKESYFTCSSIDGAKTTCRSLADLQNSVIIKHVPTNMTDEEITQIISESYESASARRFVKRDGTKLQTIKIDFDKLEHKAECCAQGIKLGNEIYRTEEYRPRQRVIQCYHCFKYGHVAKFCRQKHPTCEYCAGPHPQDDCHHQTMKCSNCNSKEHYATSEKCKEFQAAVNAMHLQVRKNTYGSQQTYKRYNNTSRHNAILSN